MIFHFGKYLMILDMQTLVLVTGVINIIQFFVFYLQYRIIKNYAGIGWWVLWSVAEVVGFGFILLRHIPGIFEIVVIIQNSAIIGGCIFIYNGVVAFLGKKVNTKLSLGLYALFIIPFLYFLFIVNDLNARGIVINLSVVSISLLISFEMFKTKLNSVKLILHVLAYSFIIHSVVLLDRSWLMFNTPKTIDFLLSDPINLIPIIDSIIIGLIWTFGFVLLISNRLNYDIRVSNNHLQLLFESSPVAVLLIDRETDTINDCNSAFNTLSGFSREEAIGT